MKAVGSYLFEGPDGEQVLVSESGNMSGNVPAIRRVQIDDLRKVICHEVVQIHDTISHIMHFVESGVFGYLQLAASTGIPVASSGDAARRHLSRPSVRYQPAVCLGHLQRLAGAAAVRSLPRTDRA
ncbi:hypothetical protein BCEP27_180042 [Burkholderia cepacia]